MLIVCTLVLCCTNIDSKIKILLSAYCIYCLISEDYCISIIKVSSSMHPLGPDSMSSRVLVFHEKESSTRSIVESRAGKSEGHGAIIDSMNSILKPQELMRQIR
jgi:hypothetical protein